MEEKIDFKLAFIGNGYVGKTNIIRRLLDRKFIHEYGPICTPSSDIHKFEFGDYSCKTLIWDITEQHKKIAQPFFKFTEGVFVVYDITQKSSFDDVDEWID